MYEFDSVSVSSYEAGSLTGKLTDKSRDGWDVVAIVPAGSEITAFLRRESSDSSTSAVDTGGYAAATSSEPAGVSEPSGWGTAPESTTTASATTVGTTAAATAPTQVATSPPTTPAVPPGWYTDPAGRYELRYWDGSAWTEHVSRAGQQYRDPPVP
jgi:uncharacterized protein DUF2510